MNPYKGKILIEYFGLGVVKNLAYAGLAVVRTGIVNAEPNFYIGKTPPANIPDTPVAVSALGTPVFDNLIINAGEYYDTNLGQTVKYNSLRLDSAILTISQQDNVVLTEIQGIDGEIIEYVSKKSFRINIKAGIFGTGNIRPSADIATLALILQSNDFISVTSNFLKEWNITEIVRLDKHVPQIPGGYNYQLFEANFIQNTPVILAQQSSNIADTPFTP